MTSSMIFPLLSAALTVPLTIYCYVLSRRLRRLNDLENGLGGAIAVMTTEITRLDQAIRRARAEAIEASSALAGTIATARDEKAYWALHRELARGGAAPARRLRPRNTMREGADA
ncbi:MAG: hypothetical protein Q4G26_00970 [Paracoccus sp. (in: a-proteobacteria)]|nr:hypothetical protein [Paracoccus sp. (in: a-proteobacteria)]